MKKNVLVQSKNKSGGKGEEPKTLGGIWKDKGFEKIKNLDEEIFRFWHEKGFTQDIEDMVFFLIYISETKNIGGKQLKEMLEKSKIDGGSIMQTLADQLRYEGKKEGKIEGKKEGKIETAKQMLLDNVSIENIIKYTGLKEKEIKALMH